MFRQLSFRAAPQPLTLPTMTPKRRTPHYIREWREFRGMTQDALAEEIGMTKASISRVENHKQPYSQVMLESIARALNTTAADLIGHDPRADDPMRPLWDIADSDQRLQIAAVAEALLKFRVREDDQ